MYFFEVPFKLLLNENEIILYNMNNIEYKR